jgi:hypothetical protein
MICKNYSEMTVVEKVLFIGELTHACMSDDYLHENGITLIETARKKGLFENVKIMPSSDSQNNTNDSKN